MDAHSRPAALSDFLQRYETRDRLRFITCGSVDDGKSTLIGRLLHDSKQLLEDQLSTLDRDSRRFGTQNGELDFALLVDGLDAEREQGITIDVAYRFFATDRRSFIVADCPGHEQYTRNMATGASTADLAVVLVDARKGLLTQTRRHSYICALFGVKQVVVAVNKMDLVEYRQPVFEEIASGYRTLAGQLGLASVHVLPISALRGDNVTQRSQAMPWYTGPALLELLETLPIERGESGGFRLPVQWVNRPNQDFRGFAGTLAQGVVRVGDAVVALPSGRRSSVARILDGNGDVELGRAGQALTLVLADEIDASRGDVLAAAKDPPEVTDQFAAHLLWLDAAAMLPGRAYWLRLGSATVAAQVTEIKHRIDVNSQEHLAAKQLELNELGLVNVSLDRPLTFAPFAESAALGSFVLIDRITHATVGAGVIEFALRRASNLHWQATDVDKTVRARMKGQSPKVIWFTGLSGSGKSTLANALEKRLLAEGRHTYLLDGDNVRHGLNRDLGFSEADRVENIRRVAEVAKLMADAGLIVLVSFISPYRSERRMARELMSEGEFIEVFVDTPLEECERRDVKGLYAKARAGEIPNFTGISAPYEVPEQPEVHLRTRGQSVEALVERLAGLI
ncbi:sulfate adenylyltransferase subunit CysN [Pseudomarimonas salicorniae]|uniref:Multifunctional fusion protein n=1 Tax=Pseudomarimonas salicorniae TaxID=2933270 RepID=A0ABT0GH44_9GAMM|nr:sulfate adenylyltransferase subunit CysN [Lysobacter sp. CAU 1642]MCK7593860.1 sulfate adenylyltransferase subunit CysN [Lysobacter sp. CAU 1642]